MERKKKKKKIGEFSAKKLSGAQAISRKSNKTRQKNKTVNPKWLNDTVMQGGVTLFDSPYQFCEVHACLLTCWQGRRIQQHRKGTSRQPWWFAVCRTGGTCQTAQGHHIWTLSRGLHPELWSAARKRSLEDKRETWHQYSQSCCSEARICCLWGKQKHGVPVSKAAVGDIICIQCLWGHWKQSVNVSKAAVGEMNTGPVRRIKTKCQCF